MSKWRYRCPKGHVNIKQRLNNAMQGPEPTAKWYCDTCKNYHDSPFHDHLIDAKTGKKVFHK